MAIKYNNKLIAQGSLLIPLASPTVDGLMSKSDKTYMLGLGNTLANMNSQISSLLHSMTFMGKKTNYTELLATPNPSNGDVWMVENSETIGSDTHPKGQYCYSTDGWIYLSDTEIVVRDFTTEPIDLTSEVVNILPTTNLPMTELATKSELTDGLNTKADKTDLHTHTNKVNLDKIGENASGELTYDGKDITVDLSNYYNKTEVYNKQETYTQTETEELIDDKLADLSNLSGEIEYLNARLIAPVDNPLPSSVVPFVKNSGSIDIIDGKFTLKGGKAYQVTCELIMRFDDTTGVGGYSLVDEVGGAYARPGYSYPVTYDIGNMTGASIISGIVKPSTDIVLHIELSSGTLKVSQLNQNYSSLTITEIPTPQAIVDVSDDHIKNVVGEEYNLKTYTNLTQLGLTAPVTVGEIYMAMGNESTGVFKIDSATNNITDCPITQGNLIIQRSLTNYHTIMCNQSASGSVGKVDMAYMGQLKGVDGTGLVWKRVCTTNVADVPKTSINLGTTYPDLFNSGMLSYVVTNSLCVMTLWAVNFKAMGKPLNINITVPKSAMESISGIVTNESANATIGLINVNSSSTKLQIISSETNRSGFATITYPVVP